ncbi:MAG: hypothetical protein PHX70_08580 [Clostridium sp.]|nr:hypothetical protein [Clostridium sp.]
MSKIDEIILKITKLAKEFSELTANGGDTQLEAKKIHRRKITLRNNIRKLKEQLLFEQYLKLQSNEIKEDVIGYEKFKEPGKELAIKVNLTWGWLRVYRNKNNQIEWY